MFEIVFVLLGWIAVALIVYTVYINLELRIFVPELPVSQTKEERFMFFYAPWCPWSKKAKPHWDAFEDDMRRFPVSFGGKNVTLSLVDGDTQPDIIKKYAITAYPTFKLETSDGNVYEMTSPPSVDAFREFLVKFIGKEEPMQLKTRA